MPHSEENLIYLAIQPFDDAAKAGEAPATHFLLLRYGQTEYTKDGKQAAFQFSENDAEKVIADFKQRGKDLVMDYDHATVKGGMAPASGWITNLTKEADGLFADVEWTDEAKQRLEKREYRYHSPVIYFGKDGHPRALHSVALTNHPAMHNYPAIAADDINNTPNPTKEKRMNETIKKLAATLAVPVAFADDGTTEDEAKTAQAIEAKLAELQTAKQTADNFLKGQNANTFDDVAGKIAGMKSAEDYAKIESELATLKAGGLVAKAFADGKLVEAQRKWAEDYAARNPEGFKAFCDNAPKVTPGPAATIPTGKPAATEDKPQTFSDEDKKILAACGMTEEDFVEKKEDTTKKEDK
jgi:phage I-like protein